MAAPTPATPGRDPWLSRPEWKEGRVKSSSRGSFLLIAIFALAWNGFIGLILVLAGPDMWDKFQRGEHAIAIFLLFPLAGLLLLSMAVGSLISWLKFGTSIFEIETLPGVVGGRLGGKILTRLSSAPDKPVEVTLACVRRRWVRTHRSGGGTESRMQETELWRVDESISGQRCIRGDGIAVPIDLYVPYECRETDESNPDDKIVWRLAASCDVPGVDFSSTFEVPVFRTQDSRPETDEERQARLDAVAAPMDVQSDAWKPPVELQTLEGGGVAFHFRPELRFKDLVGATFFTLALLAAIPLEMSFKATACFPIGTGVIALLFLVATVVMWSGKSCVEVAAGQVTVEKSVLGFKTRKAISCEQVVRVSVSRQRSQQQQQQSAQSKSAAWEITLVKEGGESVDTGALFKDRRVAKWIAAEMEKLIVAFSASKTSADPGD